jgi:hypothetical protein
MTYVYRDPARWHPVHEPEEPPIEIEPEPDPEPPPDPAPPPRRPNPKRKPRPLPEPIWGGHLGLALAAAEVDAWERLHPVKQPREEGKHS